MNPLFAWALEIQQALCAVSTEQDSPITRCSDPGHSHQGLLCRRQKHPQQSAKIIHCLQLDPGRRFIAFLGTSHLVHPPQPPRATEMLVLLSLSSLGIKGSSTCISREINECCACWSSVQPIAGHPSTPAKHFKLVFLPSLLLDHQ